MKLNIFLFVVTILVLNSNIAFAEVRFHNSNTGYEVVIEDSAEIFTDEEENKLSSQMEEITEHGNIILKTIDYNTGESSENYAYSFYHKLYDIQSNGTLLLFDMYNRFIWIYSDGQNYNLLTTEKANSITDNVYKYASYKRYYKCAKKAFEQIDCVLDGKPIVEPMNYITKVIVAMMTASIILSFSIIRILEKNKVDLNSLLKNSTRRFKIIDCKSTPGLLRKEYCGASSSSGSGHDSGGHDSGGGGHSSGHDSHSSHDSGGGGGHRF